jgi:LacI family transcriptional regulator
VRVTLRDIAGEAGVSLMTVSNVINGNHAKVSQATIARVQQIVDRRGYVPSASARTLATRSSRLIGLLVPSGDDDSLVLSPHNVAVFGIIERQLRDSGYHLLFRGVSSPAEVDAALRSWNLDGAVLLGFLDEDVEHFEPPAGTPVLALDSYSPNPRTTGVRSDDFEGGRLAAAHLIEHGHRRIVFAGPAFSEVGVVRQRFDGFLQAHRDAGLAWNESDQSVADTSYERGIELGQALVAEHPGVTAVFATADILAIGLMEGLRQAGVGVPDEVSVVGFDNLDLGRYVTPKLTTVAQDVVAKASAAVRLLLMQIEDAGTSAKPVVLGVELVARESVTACPTGASRRSTDDSAGPGESTSL